MLKPKFVSLRWLQVRVSRMVSDLSISYPDWRKDLLEGNSSLTIESSRAIYMPNSLTLWEDFNCPNVQIQYNGVKQDAVKVWQRLWHHHIVKE